MNSVFIVDDEYHVRESIKSSLDWFMLGFEIVGEAKDGRQALEQIEKLKPQIALVDINIPIINGIELVKQVRKFNPSIKIIIVTGYGEFEYAREAIEVGVTSYLLKPIDSKELVEVLMKSQKELADEKQKESFINSVKKREQIISREKLLNKLIMSKEDINDLMKNKGEFDLILSEDNLCAIVIIIDDIKDKLKQGEDIELWKFAVTNIAEELFVEKYRSFVFNGPDNQIVILFNSAERAIQNDCIPVCENIRRIIKQHFTFTISIGIGSAYNSYNQINKSYDEAVKAVRERFLLGFDMVIGFNTEHSEKKKMTCLSYYDMNDIIVILRLGKSNEIQERIQKIFSELARDKFSKEHTVFIAMNLMAVAIEFLNENNFDFVDILKEDLLESLMSKETNSELMDFVLKLYNKSIECVFQERNLGINKTVEKAKWYLEKNLTNSDLSLEKIADNIFVNSSYLSKLFKQEIGMTVVEYITASRLNKAKELLDKGTFKNIESLASYIGYNDHFYFYKCFKRQFGITPKNYLQNKSIK